ncbi:MULTISPECIES: LysR family transcriptional regulator [unclassified Pseudomonas]|uniref:LysR family transcriptional regulator n=1 Tax=unclassified Pseudomonas TaxID=196821 RepID=UPI000D3914A1|nr:MULTISPECIES: LysR family transcriptional regulator [unclassified Pseudomonas]RAU40292.1 LysR family transcriptional regulator [Pseudomonas sp. RIT 409]RAU48961.1 LysR family transcriptional regulator [Pseudomonas sp. RIT 412]
MDRFNAMRVFTRIVELGGFGKAADSLHLPRASVTVLIKQLEAHLGVQLLMRTTRQVTPTLDGQAYYERCVALLNDLDDAEAEFSSVAKAPSGVLRVDMPSGFGRLILMPALPEFTRRYPGLEMEVGMSDRPVELIRDGFDCVIRGGQVLDHSLVARPLVRMRQVVCASPAYLDRHGVPRTLADLPRHHVIEYFSTVSNKRYGLEFVIEGRDQALNLPKSIATNSADGYLAACLAGYGLVQSPYYHVAEPLRRGALIEVLGDYAQPRLSLTALYPAHRQTSRRVRVFVDWLVELCARPGLLDKPLPDEADR